MNVMIYVVDIVKNVFQVYWVDLVIGEVGCKKLFCFKFSEFFVLCQFVKVVMEVCGSVYYWGCMLGVMGYEVELLLVKQVCVFVWGNKDDVVDVCVIWLVVQ